MYWLAPRATGGVRIRVRASDMSAIFEVYMLAVALGALKTALDAGGPWYRETATFWVLVSTFVGSIVLFSVMAMAAVLFVRPRGPSFVLQTPSPPKLEKTAKPSADGADEEIDELLRSLDRAAAFGKNPAGTLIEVAESPRVSIAPSMAEPMEHRLKVRKILMTLLGPSLTAAFFGGLSAALLPASEGMLQSSFTFNTFIILTLSYGWGGLIAYSLASIFLAATES